MLTTRPAITLKEVSQIVPNLNFLETCSLLHATADAIRQGQTLGDTLEELGVSILGITDDGCGLLPSYRDISDELELINLASLCTAYLMQAYRCI